MTKITDLQSQILSRIFRLVLNGRTSLKAFGDLRSIKHTCVCFYDVIEKNLDQRQSLGMKKLVLRRTELKQLPRYLKFLCNYDELVRIEMPNPLEYSLGLPRIFFVERV